MDWGDAAGSGDDALPFLIDETAHAGYPVRGVLRIGRAPENSIVVTDPTVSRLHAEIWREGEKAMLRSLGSNGTRINGHRVPGAWELEDGDRVDIGWSSFKFTQQELPFGIHSSSRGIASVAADGAATAGAEPSARRSTMMVNAANLPLSQIPEEPAQRHTTPSRFSKAPPKERSSLISWLLLIGLVIGAVTIGVLVLLG